MINLNAALKLENAIFEGGKKVVKVLIGNAGIKDAIVQKTRDSFKVWVAGSVVTLKSFADVNSFVENLRTATN